MLVVGVRAEAQRTARSVGVAFADGANYFKQRQVAAGQKRGAGGRVKLAPAPF